MISFIRGAFLKEEPCCKILKHDVKNYFRHLRTLYAIASSELIHTQTWEYVTIFDLNS